MQFSNFGNCTSVSSPLLSRVGGVCTASGCLDASAGSGSKQAVAKQTDHKQWTPRARRRGPGGFWISFFSPSQWFGHVLTCSYGRWESALAQVKACRPIRLRPGNRQFEGCWKSRPSFAKLLVKSGWGLARLLFCLVSLVQLAS